MKINELKQIISNGGATLNNTGKRTYEGGIFTQVKGYEQLEFIVININDDKHKFPIKMLVWAKEIKNDNT